MIQNVTFRVLGKAIMAVWSGIDEVATFTKDKGLPIADFAIKNKESLGAAFATVMAALGNL